MGLDFSLATSLTLCAKKSASKKRGLHRLMCLPLNHIPFVPLALIAMVRSASGTPNGLALLTNMFQPNDASH